MKSEVMQLAKVLDEKVVTEIARVLTTVDGVSKIAIASSSNKLSIDYDEDRTSSQEIRAVLQKAGFDAKRLAHGEDGMCCGSCG